MVRCDRPYTYQSLSIHIFLTFQGDRLEGLRVAAFISRPNLSAGNVTCETAVKMPVHGNAWIFERSRIRFRYPLSNPTISQDRVV